jgi:hypothetical protein
LTSPEGGGAGSLNRPLVAGLFVASALLSIVSWFTTHQGMALYLSPWFAFLASLGIQAALVLVAWLFGITRTRRGALVAVYAVTATVSIAFSYVALHTWFASRERPAEVQRSLYDRLGAEAGQAQKVLADAVAEAQKHLLALEEMTAAEKARGYISRGADADPYLARVREAVAREATSLSGAHPEGAGPGPRYTAFDRYLALARQSAARLQAAEQALSRFQAGMKPLAPTDEQLRAFQAVVDAVPWGEVRDTLHAEVRLPEAPAYADYVDRAASGQEDLVLAFTELFSAPKSRHIVAFTLAAFIDLVVFLLAWASGPLVFGPPEDRWLRAAALLDSADEDVFTRDLLSKLEPTAQGLARLDPAALTAGERQFLLLLESRGQAAPIEEAHHRLYVLAPAIHQSLMDRLANRRLPLAVALPRRDSSTAPAAS